MMNNYLGERRCKFCQERHRASESCYIACPYCHEYHSKRAMPDSICPHLRRHVQPFHQNDQFPCRACDAEGLLQKQITTTFMETEERYLMRLQKYNLEARGREEAVVEGRNGLQRKIIRTQTILESYRCTECSGTGIIKKIINCCLEGCSRCQYERCYINPTWSNYHCDPIAILCQRREACAVCSMPIELLSKFCVLGCGHNYHPLCYVREVYLAGGACAQCGFYPQDSNVSFSEEISIVEEKQKFEVLPLKLDAIGKKELSFNEGFSIVHYDRSIVNYTAMVQEKDREEQKNNLRERVRELIAEADRNISNNLGGDLAADLLIASNSEEDSYSFRQQQSESV